MSVPTELGYTAKHEWVVVEDGIATVGITSFAAESLGDIVYVEVPEVGSEVTADEPCGEVESTKSVSDVYSPVSGEVTEVNAILENEPETINSSPFEDGWLFRARISEEPTDLLSAEEYTKLTEGEE
ncbi:MULTISPECIES: glycine cleavage system protein GcvH [Nocardiopsis]|uniref:Glycine cleavage system H protein n=1 Tax=Nocardiopsis dassonvillei (strain ATCC 23218 / DSM 43111 / CIP 107115 / JCM 7437 / KCTC 9190 / NBRC 14626 / NCTC 10488 / NRRL B-5397 / IMRU 509) TaxID=446468 RepID=D7AWA6_NOCDD|nr:MULTISPECIES: glycine cleavage system protein GcvH [Nocardiopsis]ADH65872.1 glycine cleavage system H protein [Nocardiopsis dassonvillei subsp. dassonvillei DSM 43111]NKY80456.1 glycine cleavage system protein GcvH [Nocardiopsis dassonvillei]VEI91893.1 Octanoyl/lipoyl carrier protein [Nocardiopsis dassonvillei]